MVGAPPDNIGAKRLAEGSVSASGAGSASMGAKEIGIRPQLTRCRNFPLRTDLLFAAPMAGASPDNIGAKRLAEGGVPASGAGSAIMNAK